MQAIAREPGASTTIIPLHTAWGIGIQNGGQGVFDAEGRTLSSRDTPNASREGPLAVRKDEHTPKTLSRLSRPSGTIAEHNV